jgi:hypothetical protein
MEPDPRELNSLCGTHAWILGNCMRIIAEYNPSPKKYPNPPGVNLADTDLGNGILPPAATGALGFTY